MRKAASDVAARPYARQAVSTLLGLMQTTRGTDVVMQSLQELMGRGRLLVTLRSVSLHAYCMHVLQPLIADGLRVSEVDISDSDELMQRYQMRIPVLQRTDSGAELDFPFDLAQVMDWLGDDLREEG